MTKTGTNKTTTSRIPDVLDNSSRLRSVSRVLDLILKDNETVHIASGYFNLGGYALVKDSLKSNASIRLLLGREPSQVSEITRTGRSIPILSHIQEHTEAEMDQKGAVPLIEDFAALLGRSDVEVRLFTKSFLHGKAFIVEENPTYGHIAVTGSSNFTRAGLTSNAELDTVHKQEGAVKELLDWFERHWVDAEDFKEDILSLLEDFTRPYPPHIIYMKILYEYLKDRLDVEAPEAALPSAVYLADFQHDGYMAAKNILERYKGVMLADSVGTGKTFLGLRLLEDYAYFQRMKALIICPAQLRDILWEKELRGVAIRADIVSQEELGRNEFEISDYLDHEVVLIDESHNFRNPGTNRHENLMRLLTHEDSKIQYVILLTATPVNNTLFDLYNQIRLISRDKDDYFASAGISSLWGYFLKAVKEDGDVFDILEEVTVRRSRAFIRDGYPDAMIDGELIRFPDRDLHKVNYSLERVYKDLYKEVADVIEKVRLPAHNLEEYRKDVSVQLTLFESMIQDLVKEGWSEEEAKIHVREKARGKALMYILKTLYLKRLESSIHALRISLERQAGFQQKFLENLRAGRLLDASSYRKIYLSHTADDEAQEIEIDELIGELEEVEPEKYNIELVEEDVLHDIESLGSMLVKLREIEQTEMDNKLLVLEEKLLELKTRKVVVFSYFKDTARHLYRYLRSTEFLDKIGLKEGQVSIVDSDVSTQERKDRIQRFAPKANKVENVQGTEREIQLLVSTDVLSEGQNLQDSDTIINYDLHWNPVRMIQRAGRIDRIKSDHELIHIHNFFPEDRLEDLLGLVGRLQTKLSDIDRSVGLDASTMGESVSPKDFNALKKILEGDAAVLSELERASELEVGEFLLQDLKEYLLDKGGESLEMIPHGVGSGLSKRGYKGLFAYFKGGDRDFWTYYDFKTDKVISSRLEALKAIRCKANERRVELDFDPTDFFPKMKSYIVGQLKKMKAKVSPLRPPQSSIVNFLKGMPSSDKTIDLIRYYAGSLPKHVIKELRKTWKEARRSKPSFLLTVLDRFRNDNPVREEAPVREVDIVLEEADLRLIAYLGVT